MKQKLFLGALLLGALTLNSCVDDTENIGVTNVRQAKAEQIKALAEYNKAEAEAKITKANTFKAAQEALAEYKNALAAVEEAKAAVRQAQAEGKAADAERAQIILQQAQMDLQNYAKQVEVNAAALEASLLNWQRRIIEKQMELQAEIKGSSPDEAVELQKLLKAYTDASSAVSSTEASLARTRLSLESVKAGLLSTKEGYEQTITLNQNNIKEAQDDIAELEAQLAVYEGYTNVTEANDALEKVKEQIPVLQDTYKDLYAAYLLQNDKLNNAYNAMENSAYKQNVKKIEYQLINNENWNWYWNIITDGYTNSDNMYIVTSIYAASYKLNTTTGIWGEVKIPVFNGDVPVKKEVEYSYAEGQKIETQPYYVYNDYYMPVKDGFTKFEAAVKADIKATEQKALDDAKAEYTKKETAQKAAATAKEAADAALKAAQAALTAAGDNATEAQKKAVKDAEGTVASAKATLDTANAELATEKDNVENAQNALDAVNEKLAEIKAIYDTAVAGVSDNEANMKAYNDESLKAAQAWVAQDKAENTLTLKNSEKRSLQNIVNNGGNILYEIKYLKEQIESKNNDIAGYEKAIKDAEAELAKGDDARKLKLIQWYENRIAILETQLSVQQKVYDAAKAALDAAMAEDAPAE